MPSTALDKTIEEKWRNREINEHTQNDKKSQTYTRGMVGVNGETSACIRTCAMYSYACVDVDFTRGWTWPDESERMSRTS